MKSNVKVKDLTELINEKAPFNSAMSFDNVGNLVGNPESEIKSVLIALDVTNSVIEEAVSRGCNVILTHHPVIFHPMKSILSTDIVFRLIQNNVNVISAHTNMDLAENGVNDCLADALHLKEVVQFCEDGLGRIGVLDHEYLPEEFAEYIKLCLHAVSVRYTAHVPHKISKIAVGGGSCGDLWMEAKLHGCDALVSGEAKYNEFVDSENSDFLVYAAGHYATEQVVLPYLKSLADSLGLTSYISCSGDSERAV